ncbi:MAG: YlqD family protein [Armatimonadota bacterium]|nr:YlqD family protein [Armatimonadota bacterium]MDR5697954.1 YlqD family protein [Armatimonadota bacterium]
MASITVIRPVVVKAIVTENFKDLYRRELEEALRRVEEVLNQIETQLRRLDLERQVSPQSRGLRQQLELERTRQEMVRAELRDRLREAENLVLNSEFPQTTVDSQLEIRVGDNLFSKLTRTEIVVKDGIVMEIRQG